jgi:hypothetical protein
MSAIAGGAALGVMTKLVEKAVDYNQQIAQMKMANYSPADIKTLTEQAEKITFAVPGSNLTETLKTLIDLRNISGSAPHAAELGEAVNKLNLVLQNVTKQPAGEAGYQFMKFLEDAGMTVDPKTRQFSVARITEMAQWMEAVITATRGRITGAELFQLRQSGKASVNTLSLEGLTNLLPAIQSIGPVAVGTALQGAQQQLLGAVQLRKQTVEWLERYGMLDPKKATPGKGGFWKLAPGAITGEQTMMHDLAGWVWNVLIPQMAKKGLNTEQMVDEIKRSGLRTPLLGLIAELIQNETIQKKEIGNIQQARGADQYQKMVEESPTYRLTKFTEALNNLMTELGKPLVEPATKMIGELADKINLLSKWVSDHPDTVLFIGQLAAQLSVLAVAIGLYATGTAAAMALTALAGPAGWLVAIAGGFVLLEMNIRSLDKALHEILPTWMFATPEDAEKHKQTPHPWRLNPDRFKSEPSPAPTSPPNIPKTGPVFGPQIHQESFVVPPPQNPQPQPISLTTNLTLDGRTVATLISRYLVPAANTGPATGDIRQVPLVPGMAAA